EISFNEADSKKSSAIESNGHDGKDPVANNGKSAKNGKRIVGPTTKKIGRDIVKKMDSVSKSKKILSPAMAQKYKLMKEEEERKRTEELRIQQLKEQLPASKKLPVGNKSTPPKPVKNKSPSTKLAA
ncbi:disease resistance protein, partial [Striga asiatica]